jgi:hypothetical protein
MERDQRTNNVILFALAFGGTLIHILLNGHVARYAVVPMICSQTVS